MKPAKVNPSLCRGFKSAPVFANFSADHLILYALSLGFSADPLDRKELDFTYEGSENFKAVPTLPILAGNYNVIISMLQECPGIPEFHPGMLLHVETKLDLFRPIPLGNTLTFKREIVDVEDKNSGALVVTKYSLHNSEDQLLNNQYQTFLLRA